MHRLITFPSCLLTDTTDILSDADSALPSPWAAVSRAGSARLTIPAAAHSARSAHFLNISAAVWGYPTPPWLQVGQNWAVSCHGLSGWGTAMGTEHNPPLLPLHTVPRVSFPLCP